MCKIHLGIFERLLESRTVREIVRSRFQNLRHVAGTNKSLEKIREKHRLAVLCLVCFSKIKVDTFVMCQSQEKPREEFPAFALRHETIL